MYKYRSLFTLLYTPCVKRFIYKSIHHAHNKSCWKSMYHGRLLQNYLRNYSNRKHNHKKWKETVKTRFLIIILDFQLKQIIIQEDHNSRRYFLFCLVLLADKNSIKPSLFVKYRNQIFLYFRKNKKEKNIKKEKLQTRFFNVTWSLEMKCNKIFMYNTYIYMICACLKYIFEKLACFWHVDTSSWNIGIPDGMLACLLECWQMKMRSWYAFGVLACRHVGM